MELQAKIIRTMAGVLLCPLAVGSRAIIVHQGKIILTARVTAIHHRNAREVCFETLDTRYYLLTGPDSQPAVSVLPAALAA